MAMDPLTLLASTVIAQGGYGNGGYGQGGYGQGGYPGSETEIDDSAASQFLQHSQPIEELILRRTI